MLLCYVIDSGLSTSLLLLATLIIMFYIYIYIYLTFTYFKMRNFKNHPNACCHESTCVELKHRVYQTASLQRWVTAFPTNRQCRWHWQQPLGTSTLCVQQVLVLQSPRPNARQTAAMQQISWQKLDTEILTIKVKLQVYKHLPSWRTVFSICCIPTMHRV